MKIFAIRDETDQTGRDLAYLFYYETAKQFYIELPEGADPWQTPLDFCLRMGWGAYLWQMLVVDYLLLNRDRHGANMEVLRNKKKKTLRLAPLFDHGISLLCSCQSEEAVLRFDVMEDRLIQSFIGSQIGRAHV